MSPRSEGFDIPRVECMIGLEIHVTHFQRLVRELHSDHISPFYIRANRIWLHKAFLPLRGNVLHAAKQMCVCKVLAVVQSSACMRLCMYLFVLQLICFKFSKGG